MTRLRGALLMMLVATPALADDPPTPATPLPPESPTAAPQAPDPAIPDPFVPEADPASPAATFEMNNHTYRTVTTESQDSLFGDYGFAVSAGGGVSDFTSETARGATNTGGGWDVRATIGTRAVIAGELSYLGSAQSINALGLDDSALLLGNGAQADVRLNLTTKNVFQPFFFAGVAWRHYSLQNVDTNTSDVNDSDDVLEIPVGAGIAYRYRGFILDARGEFRPSTNGDLMPSLTQPGPFTTDSRASLDRWGVTANVGIEL